MFYRCLRLLIILLLSFSGQFAYSAQQDAAIASAHPLATKAGFEILKQGGNAFDAAVAVSAALAVVEPTSSGLGGGGFWLLHRSKDGFETMIDGREKAPAAATRDMYLNKNGQFDSTKSLNGPYASGIPGVPAALVYISQKYGKLSLKQTLAPAICYAREGFKVTPRYRKLAQFRLNILRHSVAASRIFLDNHHVPKLGSLIKQPDLANTLTKIAQQGRAGFYQGSVADNLVKGVRAAGGIWTLADLHNYQVKERTPIHGEYNGYHITSAAPPSSGGIVLVSMLNQLATLPYDKASNDEKRHYLIEVMRRAYRDRSQYLGDADFVKIPKFLTSKSYALKLASDISPYRATPSADIKPGHQSVGEDTTHFSIIDSDGNRVAATLSINYPFGSTFVPPGTGVLLNDEMDDFSAQPGAPNVYGLIGNEANSIVPGKRPLSSMTPTFVEGHNRLLVIGTPGGSRIITMVLLGIMQFIDGANAKQIVSYPRFHHQYLPDEVQVEKNGLDSAALADLRARGYKVHQLNRRYGNMQVVIYNKTTGRTTAASDPRGEGAASVEAIP